MSLQEIHSVSVIIVMSLASSAVKYLNSFTDCWLRIGAGNIAAAFRGDTSGEEGAWLCVLYWANSVSVRSCSLGPFKPNGPWKWTGSGCRSSSYSPSWSKMWSRGPRGPIAIFYCGRCLGCSRGAAGRRPGFTFSFVFSWLSSSLLILYVNGASTVTPCCALYCVPLFFVFTLRQMESFSNSSLLKENPEFSCPLSLYYF